MIGLAVDWGRSASKVRWRYMTMIKCLTPMALASSQIWTFFSKFWAVWFQCTLSLHHS